LLVTRKSLDASDNRTPLARNLGSPFPVPFRGANDRRGGANKKAGAERRRHESNKKRTPDRRRKWAQGFSRRQSRRDDRSTPYFWMLE
jgi:hypothetical protein